MNLREKFEGYLQSIDSPAYVMSTAMFKKLYPEETPPEDGEEFFDFESKLIIQIDDLLLAEQVVVKTRESKA